MGSSYLPVGDAASLSSETSVTVDEQVDHFLTCFENLRITPGHDQYEAVGKERLRVRVAEVMARREVLTLVLPAFPFKSPNTTNKVLGTLPDRGEELALERIEKLCCDAEAVYTPGVRVVIFSDGRVFASLLDVVDEQLMAYKDALRDLSDAAGHTHISFDDLEQYTNTADPIRELQVLYNQTDIDMDAYVAEDEDALRLVQGFTAFLVRDLEQRWDGEGLSKRQRYRKCKELSKEMMLRNMAFSQLVDDSYPGCVRLSIHAHNNAGPKYGVYVVPPPVVSEQAEDRAKQLLPRTPWHNVICEDADGTVHCMQRQFVDTDKYELSWKFGRPWGFVEKQAVSDLPAEWQSLGVTFSPLVGDSGKAGGFNGLMIQAKEGSTPSLLDVPHKSLRELSLKHGTVVLRGFKNETEKSHFEAVASKLGSIMMWPGFGAVLELKYAQGSKVVWYSREAIPCHWDGMFKIRDDGGLGEIPMFQTFHCVQEYPVAGDSNGKTVFCDTRSVLRDLTPEQAHRLSKTVLSYETKGNHVFGNLVSEPVFQVHPSTGERVLRYHEPWTSEMQPTKTTVASAAADDLEAECEWVNNLLLPLVYDTKHTYSHSWQAGDFLMADNYAQLHWRTTLDEAGRVLRRIHVN